MLQRANYGAFKSHFKWIRTHRPVDVPFLIMENYIPKNIRLCDLAAEFADSRGRVRYCSLADYISSLTADTPESARPTKESLIFHTYMIQRCALPIVLVQNKKLRRMLQSRSERRQRRRNRSARSHGTKKMRVARRHAARTDNT